MNIFCFLNNVTGELRVQEKEGLQQIGHGSEVITWTAARPGFDYDDAILREQSIVSRGVTVDIIRPALLYTASISLSPSAAGSTSLGRHDQSLEPADCDQPRAKDVLNRLDTESQ